MVFDRIAIVDWSAAAKASPARPSADAIWIGVATGQGVPVSHYHRTRAAAAAHLHELARAALEQGARLLIGADFPFGWPAGLASALTGQPSALALWDWLAAHLQDGPDNANNRFALAAAINARLPGLGPFWGRPAALILPDLPDRGSLRHGHGLPERRLTETHHSRAQTCWKLYTTGSVGSQALLGVPVLAGLRAAFAPDVAVWPMEPVARAGVVLAEVWPSLLAPQVAAAVTATGAIKDDVQVRLLAGALMRLSAADWAQALSPAAPPSVLREEGWILGTGIAEALRAAAAAAGGGV